MAVWILVLFTELVPLMVNSLKQVIREIRIVLIRQNKEWILSNNILGLRFLAVKLIFSKDNSTRLKESKKLVNRWSRLLIIIECRSNNNHLDQFKCRWPRCNGCSKILQVVALSTLIQVYSELAKDWRLIRCRWLVMGYMDLFRYPIVLKAQCLFRLVPYRLLLNQSVSRMLKETPLNKNYWWFNPIKFNSQAHQIPLIEN